MEKARETPVQLTVNGDVHEVPAGTTVAALLARLGLPRERVAVEVNANVVRRATLEEHVLCDGDQVEVVAFVGGGA